MNTQATTPRLDSRVPDPTLEKYLTRIIRFRQGLYELLPRRADAILDLVDAWTGNTRARSPVELSLSPLFRREYGSVYDAIDNLFVPSTPEAAATERRAHEQGLLRLIASTLPPPRRFWLLGIDKTPAPRRFAVTLPDRAFVYQPPTLRGNKPVTIGHDYSTLAALPEKAVPATPPWLIPLLVRRVTSAETAISVAVEQITAVMTDQPLPFHDDLCVQVEDSSYSGVTFLGPVAQLPHWVTLVRLPGNRKVSHSPEPVPDVQPAAGHPTWYGQRFVLADPPTGGPPDVVAQTPFTTRRGQTYTVQLQGWYPMLRRGAEGIRMHEHPFTLVRAHVVDAASGTVYQRDLWLIAIGQRRGELSLLEIREASGQRYDLEHFFRLGKQRLLLTACPTSDDRREENWWQIVQLAYGQLWLAQPLAEALPRPWERYLPSALKGTTSPAAVQRDFERIIRRIGTPARAPKRRGNPPGRARGVRLTPRKRHPVVRKGQKQPRAA
jgi:hypothetical protein